MEANKQATCRLLELLMLEIAQCRTESAMALCRPIVHHWKRAVRQGAEGGPMLLERDWPMMVRADAKLTAFVRSLVKAFQQSLDQVMTRLHTGREAISGGTVETAIALAQMVRNNSIPADGKLDVLVAWMRDEAPAGAAEDDEHKNYVAVSEEESEAEDEDYVDAASKEEEDDDVEADLPSEDDGAEGEEEEAGALCMVQGCEQWCMAGTDACSEHQVRAADKEGGARQKRRRRD